MECLKDTSHYLSFSNKLSLYLVNLTKYIKEMRRKIVLFLSVMVLPVAGDALAQNPVIRDQFTADPSARVFEGRVYVYPSHDIPAPDDYPRKDWFCMADYHVFSSENLVDWTDHGVILSQETVEWVKPKSYSMWAPDCIFKDGKYYFYFPAVSNEEGARGSKIGVAVADKPYGPFVPQPKSMEGVGSIDPNPFIDKDGQAYLYWGGGILYMAKLKDNMLELAGEPRKIEGLPEGFKEGPYMFERNGTYYLTYPWVQDKTETLAYSTSDNPMGPFEFKGIIMEQWANECWTNHHSIIQYKDQWYLFYHHNDFSPEFDKNRSFRIDSLFFNTDGTIKKVTPTLRGVGVTDATKEIQIDRYSNLSKKGASVDFLDKDNKFEGWKTIFSAKDAWVQYNQVDFGSKKLKNARVRVKSATGGTLQIRLGNLNGTVITQIDVPSSATWNIVEASLDKYSKGIHNLYIVATRNTDNIEVDWVKFE